MSAADPRTYLFSLSRKEQVARLRELLDSPPLTITVTGGGFTEPVVALPAQAIVVTRGEVENILALLSEAGDE